MTSSERPRVLHIDTSREWRGGQVQLLHLLKYQDVPCALAAHPESPIASKAKEEGKLIYSTPFGSPVRALIKLRRAVADFRPDIIAVHTSHAHSYAYIGKLGLTIVHRRLDFVPGKNWIGRRKYRWAHGYICVSNAVRDVVLASGVEPHLVKVVYDGVDARPIDEALEMREDLVIRLGVPASSILIGAAGALVPHKGHEVVIRAMEALPSHYHLCIAGWGPLDGALRTLTRKLGLEKRVHFMGHIDTVPSFLKSIDVFVHPSLEEGLGQVIIEALFAQQPIVGSDVGGITELLSGRGVLVPAGDCRALASGLKYAVEEGEELSNKLLADGNKLRNTFGIEKMVSQTIDAYRSFVGPKLDASQGKLL